jgi:hypothetical protein
LIGDLFVVNNIFITWLSLAKTSLFSSANPR